MNILNKLTIKNLKLNKKRTIVTIIGIILSTALICAVSGMVSSFQATLIEDSIQSNGNQHITIEGVKSSDLKYFTNDRNVESYYLAQSLGYAKLNESQNEYKPYLYLKSYTKDGFDQAKYHLTKGRFPTNGNEIVLSETVITNGKVKIGIGDTITLDIGKRVYLNDNSVELNQNHPYNPEELGEEDILVNLSKTYTVVGFIERPGTSIEGYSSPGYTALTYADSFDSFSASDISLLFKDPNYYKDMETKLKNNDIEYNSYYLNNELLRWQMAKLSGSTLTTLLMVAGVVIGIIILTSIFVIKNSFSISITEKTKQYGMLSSIGATSKQIKKNVLYEGFILGIIGIPLGVLSGLFADYILVIIINYLLRDSLNGLEFIYKVPLIPIILTIILATITIYLSVISAARKSAKISPIEAIRNNNDFKVKSKKLKTPKIINKLFKTGGVIAYKNLKRSRKKYRTTVISLVVSISVFIALSSFITYGFKMTGIYYEELNYNLSVSCDPSDNNDCLKIYNDIIGFDNIEKYSIHKMSLLYLDMKEYATDEGFFQMNGETKENSKNQVESISIYSLGDKEYERYVKSIGGSVEKYKIGGILIDENTRYENDKYVYYNIYNIKTGDSFRGYTEQKEVKKDMTIPIVARTTERPMGFEKTYSSTGFLIISDSMMEEIDAHTLNGLYIDSNKASILADNIDKYKLSNPDKYFNYTNFEEYAKQENSMILLISIFLYGFIIVISLIGVTNIFNTITTNMNLRQKEFAMLKSIGMTSKEFNRMIILESIFYGTKSLFIGIPIGMAGSFLIYKAFLNGAEMKYIIPWTAIAIAVVVVLALISLIMHYSVKKINKQNIIETIRKDNI